jgi:hypothetical protein
MKGAFDTARSPQMQPLFIATETFTSRDSEVWAKYVSWSHLSHLAEVVPLDPMLFFPTLLPEIKDVYWPHIVNENFMLNFFVDLEFLFEQLPNTDLVDVEGSANALTNCRTLGRAVSALE